MFFFILVNQYLHKKILTPRTSLPSLNRPFAESGHMVQNKLHWDENDAVGLSKQRNSYQFSSTFLCFESPTALFASQCNLFRTMWPDPAKGPLPIPNAFSPAWRQLRGFPWSVRRRGKWPEAGHHASFRNIKNQSTNFSFIRPKNKKGISC